MSEPVKQETALPTIKLETLLQPVSTMMRNCLITKNKKLKAINFDYLEMFIPSLSDNDPIVTCELSVKATGNNRYKIEKRQFFTFTRIDADTGLTELGFTQRVFQKHQFEEVKRLLDGVGHLTIIAGDITDPKGQAYVLFSFGNKRDGHSWARYIDLGSNTKVKADFETIFKGSVRFTFLGESDNDVVPLPKQEEKPKELTIDLAVLIKNRNLGQIMAAGSVNNR